MEIIFSLDAKIEIYFEQQRCFFAANYLQKQFLSGYQSLKTIYSRFKYYISFSQSR